MFFFFHNHIIYCLCIVTECIVIINLPSAATHRLTMASAAAAGAGAPSAVAPQSLPPSAVVREGESVLLVLNDGSRSFAEAIRGR